MYLDRFSSTKFNTIDCLNSLKLVKKKQVDSLGKMDAINNRENQTIRFFEYIIKPTNTIGLNFG